MLAWISKYVKGRIETRPRKHSERATIEERLFFFGWLVGNRSVGTELGARRRLTLIESTSLGETMYYILARIHVRICTTRKKDCLHSNGFVSFCFRRRRRRGGGEDGTVLNRGVGGRPPTAFAIAAAANGKGRRRRR